MLGIIILVMTDLTYRLPRKPFGEESKTHLWKCNMYVQYVPYFVVVSRPTLARIIEQNQKQGRTHQLLISSRRMTQGAGSIVL